MVLALRGLCSDQQFQRVHSRGLREVKQFAKVTPPEGRARIWGSSDLPLTGRAEGLRLSPGDPCSS